jgi:hypothetical protein
MNSKDSPIKNLLVRKSDGKQRIPKTKEIIASLFFLEPFVIDIWGDDNFLSLLRIF